MSAGAGGGRNAAKRAAARSPAAHFSVPTLERPPVSVPPRTTEKTIAAQNFTKEMLQERRELEIRTWHENQAARPSQDMKDRVTRAVGPIKTVEERVEPLVQDKKRTSYYKKGGERDKLRELEEIRERV